MIPGTCPDCGGARPLADYLADADARVALVAALACPAELARLIVPYLALHAPPSRRVQMRKLARLISDLTALISAGTVTRHGDSRPAPHTLWQAAIEQVLTVRDAGTLTLPLDGHGYLTAVAHGLAVKGQGGSASAGPAADGPIHPSHRPASPEYLRPRRPAPVAPEHVILEPGRAAPRPLKDILAGLAPKPPDAPHE